jgi:Ca2+/H+ antiporter, TMEM165/GDT1 family
MNFEKVLFAFFILLALTLNFGFFLGELTDADQHHPYELFAALVVSLIATVLKFGDRTPVGSVLLASSLVADLQLIAAALVWGIVVHGMVAETSPSVIASVVSLSGGALLANLVSVVLLIMETFVARR